MSNFFPTVITKGSLSSAQLNYTLLFLRVCGILAIVPISALLEATSLTNGRGCLRHSILVILSPFLLLV